jgi:hypothetical protein
MMSYLRELIDDLRAGPRKIAQVVQGASYVEVKFVDGQAVEVTAGQAQQLLDASDASKSAFDELLDALG